MFIDHRPSFANGEAAPPPTSLIFLTTNVMPSNGGGSLFPGIRHAKHTMPGEIGKTYQDLAISCMS